MDKVEREILLQMTRRQFFGRTARGLAWRRSPRCSGPRA